MNEKLGGLAEGVTHLFAFHVDGEVVGYAEQMRFAHLQGCPTLRIAFASRPPYSAAICLGAGGGLARSAASWA